MNEMVFVTGATGFLGNNLVRLLVAEGYAVKALVRSRDKAQRLLGDLDVVLIEGNMLDVGGFSAELANCTLLFHTAAYFREYNQPGDHWPLMQAINVNGTLDLLHAAVEHGIEKVIYVSSAAVIGPQADGSPGDETRLRDPDTVTNLYHKSKILAELEIGRFLQQYDLPIVLILPAWIFGPRDGSPTGSGQLVQNFLSGSLAGAIDGGACVVDVRDVAQAMLSAVTCGQSGRRYIIGGAYCSMDEIFATLASVSGVDAPTRRIPYPLAMTVAYITEFVSRVTGRNALVTVQGIRNLHDKRIVNSERAIRELHVAFRPLQQTLEDEVKWFNQHLGGQHD